MCFSAFVYLFIIVVDCLLHAPRTAHSSRFEFNEFNLSFAFLFAMTHVVVVSSLYVRVGQVLKIPCDRIEITERFIAYSILMNAAVNTYHLRKTFCGKTAGKFVVAVQRNCWRTRYYTKIRKFEKTTRVRFQLMILHF